MAQTLSKKQVRETRAAAIVYSRLARMIVKELARQSVEIDLVDRTRHLVAPRRRTHRRIKVGAFALAGAGAGYVLVAMRRRHHDAPDPPASDPAPS